MSLQFHNTLTKQKQEFVPLQPGKVNMFVCGPTVYDFSHLGHAKTYVQFDLLTRVLKANGLDVFYLQNITDIDDKIIDRANEKKIAWEELRTTYQTEYLQDMTSLNNTSVTEYVRATDHIDDIIQQVQTLLDKNHAYIIENDGIYFEISSFPEYGKLSGRTEIKENDAQNDFALWKFSKAGEPVWDAPFGAGRPGWHIEDTAISEHFFGPQYDLHGGAIDLIFPHHEAEITQMESASGKSPFVGYWLHAGFLTIDGRKMSKSLHNFYTIREVLEKGYDPMAVRLLMLQTHYRASINFTFENLDAAKNRLLNWRNTAALRHQIHDTLDDGDERSVALYATSQAIVEALSDDLDTPEAFRIIDEAFDKMNGTRTNNIHQHALVNLIETIDETLGLQLLKTTPDISDDLKRTILERERAREAKDYKKADQLRAQIEKEGVTVRDTSSGPIWEYVKI
jgi:cysteinyl-tRNA synthetase